LDQLEVAPHGEVLQQVRALEQRADVPGAQRRALALGAMADPGLDT